MIILHKIFTMRISLYMVDCSSLNRPAYSKSTIFQHLRVSVHVYLCVSIHVQCISACERHIQFDVNGTVQNIFFLKCRMRLKWTLSYIDSMLMLRWSHTSKHLVLTCCARVMMLYIIYVQRYYSRLPPTTLYNIGFFYVCNHKSSSL